MRCCEGEEEGHKAIFFSNKKEKKTLFFITAIRQLDIKEMGPTLKSRKGDFIVNLNGIQA